VGEVTIAATVYAVYGEHTGAGSATEYLAGSLTPEAVAWGLAVSDQQKRSLVNAARLLNRQSWQGTKTSSVQPLAWPRTGVTYADGTPVASSAIPQEVIDASYELAALLAAKPGLFSSGSADSNIESVTAGPVNVSFFSPVAIGRFPTLVQELLAQFLGGGASAGGSHKTGGCAESQFDDCDTYSLTS